MGAFTRQSCIREDMLIQRATIYARYYFGKRCGLRGLALDEAVNDTVAAAWERLCRAKDPLSAPDRQIIRRAIADVIRESQPQLVDNGHSCERVDLLARAEQLAVDLRDFAAALKGNAASVAQQLVTGETLPYSERHVNRIQHMLADRWESQ